MSVTEEALLRAIRESPDDLLPRQALGDWMLERDDPREQALGELIQTQCRMHAVPHYSAERLELAIRERELMNAHRWEWGRMFFPGVDRVGGVIPRGGVRRGQFHLHESDRSDDWPAEARGYRWVESLFWDGWGGGIAAGPLTSSVRVLTLGGPIDPREPEDDRPWVTDIERRYPLLDDIFSAGDVTRLALTTVPSRLRRLTGALPDAPYFFLREWPRLQHLGLRGCTPASAGMVALCREARLPALRSLRLEMHDDCLPFLASAPWLAGLTDLWLRGGTLSAEVVAALPHALENLALDGDPLPHDAIPALAGWPGLASLRSLRLDRTGHRDLSALFAADAPRLRELSLFDSGSQRLLPTQLAAARLLAGVESLSLGERYADPAAFEALADSPHAARVCHLRVAQAEVSSDDAAAMLDLPALRVLELPGNGVGPTGVERLLARPEAIKLIRLDLSQNRLRDECLGRLAACRHLSGLRELDLSGNEITDKGIPALARSEHLSGLRRLRLSGNIRGRAAASELATSKTLANLVELDLTGCHIGKRGQALLRERFGDALIV